MLHFNKIPLYGVFILTFGGGLLTAILVKFWIAPYMQRKIIRETAFDDTVACTPTSDPSEPFGVEIQKGSKKKNKKDGNKNKNKDG